MLFLIWIVRTFFRCAPFWRKNVEVYPFLAKPQIQNKQVDNSQLGPKPKTTTRVDFQEGFLKGGSDGVDHVAIEVLQQDVANRGSPRV